ncbi:DNA-3-methyladenine glycosidase [Ammoniphilus oxalaticus]|uniref:DNA-3-methyladenine glycosylase I n=1 Tax=Ammoniphilus oxalaticus TaxID=66863 RepID=A0A419SK05_9BACL|nr:DNA-3-methyladenine glycosylase I [Ammoniphilus oxalaticus]RKD24371.1 DNA-3-methyladenine glycosidase [Ammoniphilus oxalaticus]
MKTQRQRCSWVTANPMYQAYHDHEWGVPCYDSYELFELLCLESAQAGLSWLTVLKKRDHYRLMFEGFNPSLIAQYGDAKIDRLLKDKGIIRHRGKIEAFIANAQAFLAMEEQGEDFASFIWSFVNGQPLVNQWTADQSIPSYTNRSEKMSQALKQRGFKFVGKTICYAFMQAAGLVNDHESSCYKRKVTRNPPVS